MNSQALTIRMLECEESKEQIATGILSALPAWFGIPESTAEYIRESKHMPFFVAYSDRMPIGFLAVKRNTHYAAEVYVMGVLPEHHRCGAGRALLSGFRPLECLPLWGESCPCLMMVLAL